MKKLEIDLKKFKTDSLKVFFDRDSEKVFNPKERVSFTFKDKKGNEVFTSLVLSDVYRLLLKHSL
jgi:hypothetical protein